MIRRVSRLMGNWFCTGLLVTLTAQAQAKLTVKDAEAIALKNHPRVSVEMLRALAAGQVITEARSGLFPTVFGSLTGVAASDDARISAGGLNNPAIYDRFGAGLTVSQLITDFGRTRNLTASAKLGAQAQDESVQATRAEILLQVDRAYYSVLQSQAVLKVAEQTVAARQLVVDQVTALAQSKLKSQLDVSFATVNLADAKLLLVAAQNQEKATFAELSAAMGYQDQQSYELADEALPPAPPADLSQQVRDAIQQRPDLASLNLDFQSALKFVQAEKALQFPTLSGVGTMGLSHFYLPDFPDRYGAVGFNLNVPIFNGRLFSARRAEADFRAQAASQRLRDLENRIARDVRVAWLNAKNGFQRLDLTSELLDQAEKALDLAQQRYDLGLSSIVELSQAQLSQTAAQIESARAKYDYQTQTAVLHYQVGILR
jgi:outer membrane protein